MYRVHGPNWAETEEVILGNRIDRIFSNFQLNDRIINKVNNNTQFSPLFVISAVIQITKSLLIFLIIYKQKPLKQKIIEERAKAYCISFRKVLGYMLAKMYWDSTVYLPWLTEWFKQGTWSWINLTFKSEKLAKEFNVELPLQLKCFEICT